MAEKASQKAERRELQAIEDLEKAQQECTGLAEEREMEVHRLKSQHRIYERILRDFALEKSPTLLEH